MFPPGRPMGMVPSNTGQALVLLRGLAIDYFVTAQMVDLITEVFDEPMDKVRGHLAL